MIPAPRHIVGALLVGALTMAAACGESAPTPPDMPPAASSRLIVQVSGLPRNAAVPAQADSLRQAGFAVRIVGPGAVDTTLLSSTTLSGLGAGRYGLVATGARLDSVQFAPTPDSSSVALAENANGTLSVSFSATTGGVDVRTAGVPVGDRAPRATLLYPDGRLDSLALPARRLLLAPGSYVLRASPVAVEGVLYEPTSLADTIVVAASTTATVRAISYQSRLASLRVAISGVPLEDQLGFATLVDADGRERTLRATGDTVLFTGLVAGRYRLRFTAFEAPRARYTPARLEDTLTIAAGEAAIAELSYGSATASLRVQATGVPAALTASVRVTGPQGFDTTVTPPARLDQLLPSSYTLVTDTLVGVVGAGTRTVRATPASRSVAVAFGDTAVAEFPFAITTGGLAVTVSGLPDSIDAQLRVSAGAGETRPGFPWLPTSSGVRHNLQPGRYVVTATAIVSDTSVFVPSPVQREVTVAAGTATDSVAVHYTETVGPSLDFAITAAYITQATQRLDGTVPLVANRDALLRVFVQANEGNSEPITVRVRLLQDTVVYRSFLIASPGASAPLNINEGALAQSWNVPIGGGDIREGMRLIADFGEAPGVSDADPANNRWPRTGVQEVDVQVVPPFSLVLVPVEHPVDSLTGAVSAGTASAFTALTRNVLPLNQVSVSVHAPYATSAPALERNNANGGWSTLLNEMEALRLMENAGNTHYMGIVGTTYSSGIAGIASIRGRNAVSWDRFPGAPRIVAHELGHNFGRFHSSGCGAQFIDANYPHVGGAIGAWGWDGSALVSPTATNDIMGYCSVQWVSDYTWTGVLNYRSVNGAVVPAWLQAGERATGTPHDSVLVVWGTVHGETAQLQPAVRVVAAPEWPAVGTGEYALDLLGSRNQLLRTIRFDGQQLDHSADVRTFAFALPVLGGAEEPVAMRLRRGGAVLAEQRARSTQVAAAAAGAAGRAALLRRSATRSALQWDSETWPLAIVRDAQTGEVVAITRRAGAELRLGSRQAVRVTLSDGMRSVTRELTRPR